MQSIQNTKTQTQNSCYLCRMSIVKNLQESTIESLSALYSQAFTDKDFQINQTKPEFEGDYTVVMFSLVKSLKLSPDTIGNQLGEHLVKNNPELFTERFKKPLMILKSVKRSG